MNNNNNNIILPIYLQNFIIKILCNYINRKNKIFESFDDSTEIIENDVNIKKLTLSISLVNKSWFKTIQNNIDVSYDLNFNYKDLSNNTTSQLYSIIQLENIKTLKVCYSSSGQYFYKCSPEEIIISIDEINNILKFLSTTHTQNCFKRLIISNYFTNHNSLDNILNQLYECSVTKSSIELVEIEIDIHTTIEYLNKFKDRIKKLHSIIFNFDEFNEYNNEFLIEILKMWYKKGLKQISIYFQNVYFPIIQLLCGRGSVGSSVGSNINYLKNLQRVELMMSEITLDDLICLISLPNLSKLNIQICFDKLNYYLSTFINQEYVNGIFKSSCNTTLLYNVDDGNNDEEQLVFNEKWKLLLKLAKLSKSLKYFEIENHRCSSGGVSSSSSSDDNYYKSLINGLSEFISSIKSIIKFTITGPMVYKLFNEIINENQTTSSIIHFVSRLDPDSSFCNYQDKDYENYINEIDNLINTHNHIKSFKVTKMGINNNNFIEDTIYNYNK